MTAGGALSWVVTGPVQQDALALEVSARQMTRFGGVRALDACAFRMYKKAT